MLVGDTSRIALDLEVESFVNDRPHGRFLPWLDGTAIGDAEDRSVDLAGCLAWLRSLVDTPPRPHPRELFAAPRDEAFRRLTAPLDPATPGSDPSGWDTYARHHLSHVGTSSFDRVTLVLVGDGEGRARFLWQQGDGEVGEVTVSTAEVRAVVAAMIDASESLASTLSAATAPPMAPVHREPAPAHRGPAPVPEVGP